MEKKQEQIELAYRIIKIYTTKFTFEDYSEEEIDHLLYKKDNLSVRINTSLSSEIEKSIINLDINTELVEKEIGKILVEHSSRTSYEFQGIDRYYNKEKEAYDIPDDLAIQLYGIAYTHARALLAVEISRTVYKDKYLLPVIDPSLILQARNKEE